MTPSSSSASSSSEHPRSRTPPTLKWLLNKRAMLLGESKRLASRVSAAAKQVEAAQVRLREALAGFETLQGAYTAVDSKIQALDTAIEAIAPGVSPQAVQPVNAWAGKYGRRSGLKEFVCNQLREAYPESRTTRELCRAVQAEFNLVLLTRKEKASFTSTVRSLLSIQRRAGVVESLPAAPGGVAGVGLWRWCSRVTTLDALRAQEVQLEKDSSDTEVATERAGSGSR